MADNSCFTCKKSLSEPVDGDSRIYRRFCCGIRAHHSCIGFMELSDCEACRTPPSGVFIWLPVIQKPTVIVIDYEPARKKAKTAVEFECSICLEEQLDDDDRLIKTRCCQQRAHVSCVRQFYQVPSNCKDSQERSKIAETLGTPDCFICRKSVSNGVFGMRRALPEILPRVTDRKIVQSVAEANQVLEAWIDFFATTIENETIYCVDKLSSREVTVRAVKQTGKVLVRTLPIPTEAVIARKFADEIRDVLKCVITEWAGLEASDTEFNAITVRRFSLYEIVAVTVAFEVVHSCENRISDRDLDALPFKSKTALTKLSEWKLVGHFFDFENITRTLSPKQYRWNRECVD